MISRRNFLGTAAAVAATGTLAACSKKSTAKPSGSTGGAAGAPKSITLGFSQVGSESGWRAANTKSVKDAAAAAGITLKFSDAEQKQENQIQAIRDYISQKVDVISFSPVVTTGWDTVLKEAQAAKIPVILTDRQVDSDPSLFVTLVGSDFENEGERAAHMMEKVLAGMTGPINMAVLEGTSGSAPAIERAKGFKTVMDASDPNWKIVASQDGNFTRDGGKTVMAALLQAHPEINVLFAHNDDMGLGGIESIEAAGKKPGTDIKIVTVDGTHDGFVAMAAGKINGIIECNPLLGPQLMDTIKTVLSGGTVEKWIKTKEGDFSQDQAAAALPTRQY